MQYRTKKRLTSKLRRAIRWEFWPMSVFYIPVVVYIVFLTLRHRGLLFLSVNPGLPMSGLIGERKAQTLAQLKGSKFLARFEVIEPNDSVDQRVQNAEQIMALLEVEFPVVLKPDFGQRGQDVAVIRSSLAMRDYLANTTGSVLLQEHVAGEEYGVFYMCYPQEQRAQLFSITEKTFPTIEGDGQRTFEELLMDNSRTHYMAEFLLKLHADKLTTVLAAGEQFKVVEIGSHCRGAVFLDGNRLITEDLAREVHSLSESIDGFYFGRYDIRVPSSEDFQAGQHFKVLEVNGVTSESTNIYDPSHSVIDAYKILFTQWRAAFEIGKQSINLGAQRVSLLELFAHLRKTYG